VGEYEAPWTTITFHHTKIAKIAKGQVARFKFAVIWISPLGQGRT